MVNFTPSKAHPQGRVGGLTDAKIVYFGEFARADLSERAMSPSWGGGEKGESWELLPRLLAGEVVPLSEDRGTAVIAHRLIHYIYE